MDQKKLLGQRVRERRKFLGWRLDKLGKEADLNISSLSKIENGDGSYNPSEDALERIAKALDTKLDTLRLGTGNFSVGVGACLWSAPLLHMIAEERVPSKFSICYQTGDDDIPIWHDQTKDVPKNVKLCTAKDQVEKLSSKDMDLVFVPRGTYSHESGNISRVCSIMNTVKGGLVFLVVSKKDYSKSELIKAFHQPTKSTCVYYAKRTIAEQIIDQVNDDFYTRYQSKALEAFPIEINKLDEFQKAFIKEIKKGDIDRHNYAYIGWEPHISYLRENLLEQGYGESQINEIELHEIVDEDQPFHHIYFDCIIAKDKLDFFKQSGDLIDLFENLDWAINRLNQFIVQHRPNVDIKEIAKNLFIDPERALKYLHKINFELTFSKEWELHKTKGN